MMAYDIYFYIPGQSRRDIVLAASVRPFGLSVGARKVLSFLKNKTGTALYKNCSSTFHERYYYADPSV